MMQKSLIQYLPVLAIAGFAALFSENCTTSTGQNAPATAVAPAATTLPAVAATDFGAYWYQGKAEIAAYDVTQERYGENRPAEQVMVFVTEDFSAKKQVKLDDAESAGTDRVPVLKINAMRRFTTGIYDYSMMQSVFTPVETAQQPRTLKTTCTVQDWCGQVFMQANLEGQQYRFRSFSYFETESDTDTKLPGGLLEDELWARLRLNPAALPQGAATLVPAAFYVRLRHKPLRSEPAQITTEKGAAESVLKVAYQNIPRQLDIRYETSFPHRILGWEERDNGRVSSKGTLKTLRQSAYWSENSGRFDGLRDTLQLKGGL